MARMELAIGCFKSINEHTSHADFKKNISLTISCPHGMIELVKLIYVVPKSNKCPRKDHCSSEELICGCCGKLTQDQKCTLDEFEIEKGCNQRQTCVLSLMRRDMSSQCGQHLQEQNYCSENAGTRQRGICWSQRVAVYFNCSISMYVPLHRGYTGIGFIYTTMHPFIYSIMAKIDQYESLSLTV